MFITTTVTINIARNEFSPEFDENIYQSTISEHDAVGMNITRVHANDADLEVIGSVKILLTNISH